MLDACCLGLKCFASDCNSHNEIRELYDFRSYLEIYSPKSFIRWNEIFNNESLINISERDVTIETFNRINRYLMFNTKIKNSFKLQLSNLINNQ